MKRNVNLSMEFKPQGVLLAVCLLVYAPFLFAATTRVDLEVESLQIQPPRPTTEIPTVAVATLRNNGSEPVKNFYVNASLKKGNRRMKTIEDVPVLSQFPRGGSGLSVPVELGKLEAGKYEVTMEVDSGDRIKETNEGNNRRAKRFEVWSAGFGSQTLEGYKV